MADNPEKPYRSTAKPIVQVPPRDYSDSPLNKLRDKKMEDVPYEDVVEDQSPTGGDDLDEQPTPSHFQELANAANDASATFDAVVRSLPASQAANNAMIFFSTALLWLQTAVNEAARQDAVRKQRTTRLKR